MSAANLKALRSGLSQLGLEPPASLPAALLDYIALLHKWNRHFNLTAIRDQDEMVVRHLLDSLAVLSHIGGGVVIDVGSGAGLPGIPLALARPGQRFVLVDTNGKKARFMQQAKIELGLDNVEVVHRRIEDYCPGTYFDVVIARAWADVGTVVHATQHLHGAQTRILVMQGKADTALNQPGYRVKALHVLEVPGLDAERHLLEIVPDSSVKGV